MDEQNIVWLVNDDNIILVDKDFSREDLPPGAIYGKFFDDTLVLDLNELDHPMNSEYFVRLWNATFDYPLAADQVIYEVDGEHFTLNENPGSLKKMTRRERLAMGLPTERKLRAVGDMGEELVAMIPGVTVIRGMSRQGIEHDVDYEIEYQGQRFGVEVKTNSRTGVDPYRYRLTGYGKYSLGDVRAGKAAYAEANGLIPGTLGITIDFPNRTFDACLLQGEVRTFLGGANTMIAKDVPFDNPNQVSPVVTDPYSMMGQRVPTPFQRPGETNNPAWKKPGRIPESKPPEEHFGSTLGGNRIVPKKSAARARATLPKWSIMMGLTPDEFYGKYKEILENSNSDSYRIKEAYEMLSRADLPQTHVFPDLIELAKDRIEGNSANPAVPPPTEEDLKWKAIEKSYKDFAERLAPFGIDENSVYAPFGEHEGYFTQADLVRKTIGDYRLREHERSTPFGEYTPEQIYEQAKAWTYHHLLSKHPEVPAGILDDLEFGVEETPDDAARQKRRQERLDKYPVWESKVASDVDDLGNFEYYWKLGNYEEAHEIAGRMMAELVSQYEFEGIESVLDAKDKTTPEYLLVYYTRQLWVFSRAENPELFKQDVEENALPALKQLRPNRGDTVVREPRPAGEGVKDIRKRWDVGKRDGDKLVWESKTANILDPIHPKISANDGVHRELLRQINMTIDEYRESEGLPKGAGLRQDICKIRLENFRDTAEYRGFPDLVEYVSELLQEVGFNSETRKQRHEEILRKWAPHEGNILDPIHDELDQRVFDGIEPRMVFFNDHTHHVREVFRQNGYDPHAFLFYLTGSICTYQYSETSDCDITVVCRYDEFPEIDRSDLVQIVTMSLDGDHFPGTEYPYQHFVQPEGVKIEDLFPIGLRSAYDLQEDYWISPPDPNRVTDIQGLHPDWWHEAIQHSDKMNILIDGGHYEEAFDYYKMLHERRVEAFASGLGDVSSGNVFYKFVINNGTVDRLRAQGYHIAT